LLMILLVALGVSRICGRRMRPLHP
jgi:DNA-directed RNA polymerase subunit N (RpoN/RPB10)